MNISNSEIRAKARAALGNEIFGRTWLMALLVGLIISAILGAANSLCMGLGSLLLSGPLYVGLYKTYLKIAQGDQDVKIETAFEGCYSFGPNLVLGLMHTLYIFLWTLLFIIPGIIKSYSYALAYYIKAEHPEYGWRECLNESEKMMQGNKMRLFILHLSFIGWALLSIFTFGLASLWVNAYQQTATAIFYEELKKEQLYQ